MNRDTETYPKAFLDRLNAVTGKRARTVIEHILQHGFITSEQLQSLYHYEHAPRAIRDVREQGIAVETFRVKNASGKSIAAYRFGTPADVSSAASKKSGRTALSRALKKALIEKYGARCTIYQETMDEAMLQIDHRIPFEIGGEHSQKEIEAFMLLSPSANRAKSWACEHCANWAEKNPDFCVRCFWAHPENHEHIAGKPERQVCIVFTGDEVKDYERLIALSGEKTAQATIKNILRKFLA